MAVIYDLSSNNWSTIFATGITFVLATLLLVARLLSRFWILKTNTADDWFIFLAWTITFAMSISIIFASCEKNIEYDLSAQRRVRILNFVFAILYNLALMATKTSILIFYIRILKNTQNLLRIASYVTLVTVNVFGIILTILTGANYDPSTSSTTSLRSAEKSYYNVVLYLCSAPINLFSDAVILILPIPVLTAMRLPPKQKAGVVATFAMGIYVTIIGIIRIYYLQEAIPEQRLNVSEQGFEVNPAWSASKVYMWSAVEVNIGIICCCIPTLKPLVKKKFSSIIFRNVPDTIPLRPLTHQNTFNTRQKITNGLPGIVLPHGESQHHVGMVIPNISPEITLFLSTKDSSNSIQHIEKSQDFGFAKPMCPISILKLSGWESFKYCALITVLFFLWGFSYGLLFNLNNTTLFSPELSTSNISLSTAYFSSYLIGALIIGKQVLQSYGFKATFITGLFIYATGALVFWPSVVLTSYPGLVISNIIFGTGVSVIETAANPFVVLCGPQSKSEFRLLLAQSVQALAATLSRGFISKIVAHDIISLLDLRWAYIAIMLFNIALSLGISYVPLPEGLDDELEIQTAGDSTSTSRPTSTPIASPASALTPDTVPRYRPSHHILISMVSKIYRLIMSWNIIYVIALFFYVPAQETLSLALMDFLSHLPPKVIDENTPFKFYDLIAYSLFAIGRLVFALLCLVFAPRILLFVALIFCLIIVSISAILPRSSIITGTKENFSFTNLFQGWALIVFFFEGPIFPLVFALGMRRMRGRNKSAAANMIAAVSGGGTFPWIVPMARNRNTQRNIRVIFGILVVLFTVCTGILIPDIVWWGGKDKEVTQTLDVE